MDIDRTPELLTWLFGQVFGRSDQTPSEGTPGDSPPALEALPAAGVLATAASTSLDKVPSAAGVGALAAAENPLGQQQQAAEQGAGAAGTRTEVAVLGGGCFWCIEACLRELQGVVSVTSGYAGGHVENPTYQQVLTKTTGHAEVVKVEYDPAVLSYRQLLEVFLTLHDPTTPNQSGNDVGPQYRSIILTTSDQQRGCAQQVIAEVNRGLWFFRKACTEIAPLKTFYPAESYHQRYYSRNPNAAYCAFVVSPKLQELRRKHSKLLRRGAP